MHNSLRLNSLYRLAIRLQRSSLSLCLVLTLYTTQFKIFLCRPQKALLLTKLVCTYWQDVRYKMPFYVSSHKLYSSPNIWQIKARTWGGRSVWQAWQRKEKWTGFWWEKPERGHLKDQGRMGSEWILGRLAGRVWSGFSWLPIGAGCCECGDELSGSGAMD
jgi:hypothetical protein